MNEELNNAIVELINKSLNIIDNGGEFLAEQLPSYVSQLITWYGVYNAILCTIGLVLIPVAFKWPYWIFKEETLIKFNKSRPDLPPWQTLYIFSIPMLLFSHALCNLIWLKIWLAPKVWLVEYAMNLSK